MTVMGVIVRDADGDEFQGGVRTSDEISHTLTTELGALLQAFQVVSRGSVTGYVISLYTPTTSPVAPESGVYATVQDRLTLRLRCEDGSVTQMDVPAPDEAVFLEDAVNVDPDNDDIIALVAAASAYVVSSGGSPVSELISGKRRRVEYQNP